jgi:hypothetical protein
MDQKKLERLRNSPAHGGHGDGSGLLALYPIARDSAPTTAKSRELRRDLNAVEHVIGLGMVFPVAETTEGRQTYVTADLRAEVSEEFGPDDEPDDEPDAAQSLRR